MIVQELFSQDPELRQKRRKRAANSNGKKQCTWVMETNFSRYLCTYVSLLLEDLYELIKKWVQMTPKYSEAVTVSLDKNEGEKNRCDCSRSIANFYFNNIKINWWYTEQTYLNFLEILYKVVVQGKFENFREDWRICSMATIEASCWQFRSKLRKGIKETKAIQQHSNT